MWKKFSLLLATLGILTYALAQDVQPPSPQPEPLTWNADVTKKEEGRNVASFHGKWINYLDVDDKWKKIDPTLRQVADGFLMDKGPFIFKAPLYADGQAILTANNRWDVFDRKKIEAAPMDEGLLSLDAAHVAGTLFNYDAVGQTAVLYAKD